MKYILLIIFISFLSQSDTAQTKLKEYYFDKDLNIVQNQSRSVFTGKGIFDSGLLQLKVYNNLDKSLIFKAHYTDSSLKVMNGLFQSYYNDGNIEDEGIYINGKENGLWQEWDKFGNIVDSSVYENGTKLFSATFRYHPNQNIKNVIISDYKNNKFYATNYDEKGDVIIDKPYDEDLIFTKTEIAASFPGGESALKKYISIKISQNSDVLTRENISGICCVRFIVDKEGKVKNVEALTLQGSKLARIAVEAIEKGPKWMPAQQNGRFVTAFREIMVPFNIPNN